MIEFQKITDAEGLAAIRAIADEVWPETFAPILSPEQIAYMMEMMYAPQVMADELAQGYTFEIVRIDGEDAGYLVCSPYHDDRMKIHNVYLRSRFHGRGVGQAMLEEAQRIARSCGFKRVRLNVNKQNFRAIKAYERNGFCTVESVKNPIGNGFFMDDFVMEKRIGENE